MMPYVGLFDFVASHEKLRQSEHTIHEKKAKESLGTLAHNACHLSSSLFAQRTNVGNWYYFKVSTKHVYWPLHVARVLYLNKNQSKSSYSRLASTG